MKMLVISLATFASALAMGKASSEYYFQPAAGAHAVELIYNNVSSPMEQENAGVTTDLESTANDFIVRYMYGLDDSRSWGAYTFFGSREYNSEVTGVSDDSNTADGVGDIHVFYKAFHDMWHYEADLGVNTEKIDVDATSGLQDNRSSGGSSLNLRAGRMWTDNSWNYGADLSYLLLLERTYDDATDTKLTGGDIIKIAGFGEYNHGAGFAGGELSYNIVNELKSKASGVTQTTDAENFIMVKLFGTWEFTDMVTGLVSLNQSMHESHDITPGTAEVKSFTETGINIGARLNF